MQSGGRERVTSRDVAQEAGVSQSTVSLVLNPTAKHSIPERTRQRVLAAVEALGYTPSQAARTLRRGRSTLVLFLVPQQGAPSDVLSAVIAGLTTALDARGLTLVTRHGADGARSVSSLWRELLPAVVLACDTLPRPVRDAMLASGVQVIDRVLQPDFDTDARMAHLQVEIGRRQLRHLAGTGHRRFGFAAHADPFLDAFSELRLHGAATAAAELGLPAPDVRRVLPSIESVADPIAAWTAGAVTAVCAYNDEIALALCAGARRQGLEVPAGLAVIGVDDIAMAQLCDPPLTTVRIDHRAVAAYLAQSVLRSLEIDDTAPVLPLTTIDVVVRGSA